jgi:hypothetical protein
MTGYRSSTCRRSRPAVEVQAAKALYNTVDSQSAFKSGHARAAGVAVSERAMAESSGASHNVLLGELSGRDRADAVLARLEATYVNRVSCQQLHFLLRLCQDCAVQCMQRCQDCAVQRMQRCQDCAVQCMQRCQDCAVQHMQRCQDCAVQCMQRCQDCAVQCMQRCQDCAVQRLYRTASRYMRMTSCIVGRLWLRPGHRGVEWPRAFGHHR